MNETMPHLEDDEFVVTRAELVAELRRRDYLDIYLGQERSDWPGPEKEVPLRERLDQAISGWLTHFKLDPSSWQDYVTSIGTSQWQGKDEVLDGVAKDTSCGKFLYDATYADIGIEQNDPDWLADVHIRLRLSHEFSVCLMGYGQFWEEDDGDINTEMTFNAQFERTKS